jgi:hypothetical protein
MLGHFFRHQPLLPIGWSILQTLRQRQGKLTNKTVISKDRTKKPLTKYSQLVFPLTVKNTFMENQRALKSFKIIPPPLFRPRSIHTILRHSNCRTSPFKVRLFTEE